MLIGAEVIKRRLPSGTHPQSPGQTFAPGDGSAVINNKMVDWPSKWNSFHLFLMDLFRSRITFLFIIQEKFNKACSIENREKKRNAYKKGCLAKISMKFIKRSYISRPTREKSWQGFFFSFFRYTFGMERILISKFRSLRIPDANENIFLDIPGKIR